MKALSIRQPWVWSILVAGKRVENRDWKPRNPGLRFRGEFVIHASSGMTKSEYSEFVEFYRDIECGHPDFATEGHSCFGRRTHFDVPAFDDLARGGFVGTAVVVDVVTQSDSRWFFGPVGLVLENVKPIPLIPFKGSLGFFDVPVDVEQQIRMAA